MESILESEPSMGVLAGLGNAQPSVKTPTLTPGKYRLQVQTGGVKLFRSPKDQSDFFIVNFKVVESSNEAHPLGATRGYVVKITGNLSALGNIKAVLAACAGLRADKDSLADIDESFVETAISSDALAGVVVDVDVHETTTRKGTPFNVHSWSPVTDK